MMTTLILGATYRIFCPDCGQSYDQGILEGFSRVPPLTCGYCGAHNTSATRLPDLRFENHGTVGLVRPLSQLGQHFLDTTHPEDAQFLGQAMAVEPRYVAGVIDAAVEAGLKMEVA